MDPSTKGDALKLERFKYMYESFKLVSKFQPDSSRLKETQIQAIDFVKNPDFELWMHADILRLEGEFALAKGQLRTAKERLLQSISKNKKEAKTWIAYGRLNDLVFREGCEAQVIDDNDPVLPEPMDTTPFEQFGGQKGSDKPADSKEDGEPASLKFSEKSIQNAFKGYFCGLILN